MQRRVVLAISMGLVAGMLLPTLTLGLYATPVCRQGTLLGWSGPLASPQAVMIAPPGGGVNSSVSILEVYNSSSWSRESWLTGAPNNASTWQFETANWSLYSQSPITTLGLPFGASCSSPLLVWSNIGGGCSGCWLAPPVAGGVGHRVNFSAPTDLGNLSMAVLNLSYPTAPAFTFEWSAASGAISWSNSSSFSAVNASVGSYSQDGQFVGLGITVTYSSIGFEVPIHLLNGGEELVPASYPGSDALPPPATLTLSERLTYVFPVGAEEGAWAVYLPGGGGPTSPGGWLFEQTSET